MTPNLDALRRVSRDAELVDGADIRVGDRMRSSGQANFKVRVYPSASALPAPTLSGTSVARLLAQVIPSSSSAVAPGTADRPVAQLFLQMPGLWDRWYVFSATV